jgi:thioredoxin reductase
MVTETYAALIGAGPYGLSIAAHLSGWGVEHRIVGNPMSTWLNNMPKGMQLKSEGFASSLYDPKGELTLGHYCREHGFDYADLGLPPRLETFTAYGLAFQKRFVPELENNSVARLAKNGRGYTLTLHDGSTFSARKVIVAAGISHFTYIPPELAHLPPEFMSHAADHSDPAALAGRNVAVIGGGSSAIDLATLLHETGADVSVIARGSYIKVYTEIRLPRSLMDRIRAPHSGIGPSWRSVFYANAPHVFHGMPARWRLKTVRSYLGPAGGHFMQERFARVGQITGCEIRSAQVAGDKVDLTLSQENGETRRLTAGHVIAATGYKVDLRRLPFLSDSTLREISSIEHTPVLSRFFESSLSGLYFVGPAAANSFGPVMRFAYGAKFASPWISRSIALKYWTSVRPGRRNASQPNIYGRPHGKHFLL